MAALLWQGLLLPRKPATEVIEFSQSSQESYVCVILPISSKPVRLGAKSTLIHTSLPLPPDLSFISLFLMSL